MDALFLAAVGLLGLQRVGELAYAHHTAKRLEQEGARLVRADGYGALVAVHVIFFAGCLVEGILAPWPGLGWWSWIGLTLFLVGQVLRYWSMAVLGWRWSTRVYVLPSAPLVAQGPYRWLRHPIYVGVALELFWFPFLFGLWGTAILVSIVHPFALLRRIRLEEAALGMPA